MHRCCGITQACWRQHFLYSAFFSQRILSIFASLFFYLFYLLSSPVPCVKKSPNNYFFDKVSPGAFFLFHLFFLLFLGLKAILLFDVFLFFRVWGKANSWVWRGPGGSIFAVWELESDWCISHFSPGHVTPHCGSHWWIFMGVFCSFHKLTQSVVGCLLVGSRPSFWILSSNTIAFYFSAKGCQKVVSCASIHFLLFGQDLHVKSFVTEGDILVIRYYDEYFFTYLSSIFFHFFVSAAFF